MPINLRSALDARLSGAASRDIKDDARKISSRYRGASHNKRLSSENEALAYAAARMPATFGAVHTALKHSLECLAQPLTSLLDIGAGTGAASWASSSLLELDSITCIEREKHMSELGRTLMHSEPVLSKAIWADFDISTDSIPFKADLVIASYVVNELPSELLTATAQKLWASANKLLLLVEPGTPDGYKRLNTLRSVFLGMGAHILAPCTHERPCPIQGGDWCHFSCRIPRSKLHKSAKGGDAPYEDEKFAYLTISREKSVLNGARVLRHPLFGKGYRVFVLCAESGISKKTYSKKDGGDYQMAKKLCWGDHLK